MSDTRPLEPKHIRDVMLDEAESMLKRNGLFGCATAVSELRDLYREKDAALSLRTLENLKGDSVLRDAFRRIGELERQLAAAAPSPQPQLMPSLLHAPVVIHPDNPPRPINAKLPPTMADERKHMNINQATSITEEEVRDLFVYHPWTAEQIAKGDLVRQALANAARVIVENVPPSPDRTVALRKIREARMDANSAITHNGKY